MSGARATATWRCHTMAIDPKDAASNPGTRTRILDATEEIMLEEGYAGVSSRKVAAKAGL